MNITLIICTYNRAHCVDRLLKSIECQTDLPGQILVIDASEDRISTEQVVRSFDIAGLEYYHTEKGLTLQRNFGIEKASGDVVGLLDDDMVPDKSFLMEVKKVFKDSNADCVVPYIYEDNTVTVSGLKNVLFNAANNLWGRNYLNRLLGLNDMPGKLFNGYIENVSATGCSFYKREIFEDYGFAKWMHGYSYGEDLEFGIRISRKYKIIGSGDARVHHYHESSGRDNIFMTAEMSVYNFVRIIDRSSKKYIILSKIDVLLRRFAGVIYQSMFSLFTLKLNASLLYLGGGIVGFVRALPWLIKRDTCTR